MTRQSHNSLRRRSSIRGPRQRFLILCEGKVTEPSYFCALRHEMRSRIVEVEVIPECGVPKSLVEHAVERKRAAERDARRQRDPFLKFDEIWCVFDVDSHPNLREAIQQAQDNGLMLAISNPCFELWVLLHFQDQFAERGRDEIQRFCKEHIPEYKKQVPYAKIQQYYEDAVRRAQSLDLIQERRETAGGNPSTGVYRLTEKLRASEH